MEAQSINNSPEIVVFAFVDLYYRILQKFTNQVHQFYKENSVLTWLLHREIESVKFSEVTTESKVEDTIKDVFDNSENKVTKDDQVVQKPSLTSNDKEKFVAETAQVVYNEAPKLSYASIKEVSDNSETKMKQSRSSPLANTPYKNVRVVAEDGLLSILKMPEASGLVQALTSSLSGVSKAATASTNVAQGRYKSIYIGGLPTNTTRSDLYAIVKEFGLIDIQDVQLKTYEDGYCVGIVHFQDKISAKKAVQMRYITVKGREVYIRYKRLNKESKESLSLSKCEKCKRIRLKEISVVSKASSSNRESPMMLAKKKPWESIFKDCRICT
ncbi:hypothetical protein FXO37_29958 [Capsicum annuum]|nr:hypothetical protein FXO37_29958 [Capsicum annuum]